MAALQRAAETGGAGIDGKTAHIEMEGDGLTLNEMEGDIGILWDPRPAVTIQSSIWYLRCLLQI